jgi:diguanylate cyclase (GGDEF)-like protein/PAS domain S-box-containing protein
VRPPLRRSSRRREDLEEAKRVRLLIEQMPAVLWSTDVDLKFTSWSGGGLSALGIDPVPSIGMSLFEFFKTDDPEARPIAAHRRALAGESVAYEGSWWNRTFEVHVEPLKDGRGRVTGAVGVAVDITDRKLAEERVVYQSYHDALTGLPNRLLFADHLAIAVSHARRVGGHVAVLCLDLDHFKLINDTLGHTIGDHLLEAVAGRLARCVREEDTVARAGGDEFTILVTDPNGAEEPLRIARTILEAVARPLTVDGHELYVTASIGVATYPEDGEDVETLLKNGDNAMYRSKELGRNTVQLCTAEMNRRAVERLAVENGLRHAPEREELIVHYQPFYEAATRRVSGIEALLRWRRPGIGLVLPENFLGVAEETRLILPIGSWILSTACQQLRTWQATGLGHLRLAVNLSMRQFQQPDLAQTIVRIVKKAGVDPSDLELEITESVAMQDADLTLTILRDLREAGMGIALDDFGTGHASLNYLKTFPITKLKIDQSFVADMRERPENGAIVRTIIAMAHDLHLTVTAEGVENSEQLEELVHLGCDEVQGFLLAMPQPADACETVLRALPADDRPENRHERSPNLSSGT